MANRRRKKRNYVPYFIILGILVLALVVIMVLYFTNIISIPTLDKYLKKEDTQQTSNNQNPTPSAQSSLEPVNTEDGIVENIIYDDLQIHFLMLGNTDAGDSIYIKAGDNDILIDAGSQSGSIDTIKTYINNYCKDNKLEYVITTHGDTDHIAAMYGTKESTGYNGILYSYQIDTLIDFNYTTKNVESQNSNITKYNNAVAYAVEKGTKHLHGSDFFEYKNNEYVAKSDAQISLTENIKMDILYNKYYFENTSSDENNYSVCSMITYNNYHFMLTGDLEKEGEMAMAEYYDGSSDAKTLPNVDLYKAGHHGSKTSSNLCLLEKIRPRISVASCCAGTNEYTTCVQHQFPTQSFINHIAKYTDRVYVPSTYNIVNEEFELAALNGNIVVSSDGTNIGLYGSNNLTKLKDTEWFNKKIYAVKAGTYKDTLNNETFDIYNNSDKKGKAIYYDENTANAVLIPTRIWPEGE